MNESIENAAKVEEQNTTANVPETDAAAVQTGAENAAARAAEQEAAAQAEALATLKALVKSYSKGEKAYRAGLLEAGRLADLYLHQRMALGASRKAAIVAIEGELAKYASNTPDANRLVLSWHAYRLLAVETQSEKAAESVPYGHFRDQYARLVERTAKDTTDEAYVLLPGLESDCRTLFADATKVGLSRDDVGGKVQSLLKLHADRQADAAKKAKADADAKAVEDRKAADAAKENAAQAGIIAAKLAEDVQTAKDEDKAAMTAKMETAKEAQRQAEADAIARNAEAEQAERERARKEKEAKDAEEAQKKADEKERKRKERQDAKEKEKNKPATVNVPEKSAVSAQGTPILMQLAASAGKATAKDFAGVLVDAILTHGTPNDVFQEVIDQFVSKAKDAADAVALSIFETMEVSRHLSKEMKDAAKMAQKRAALTDRRSPSPAEVASALTPNVNGQLAYAS